MGKSEWELFELKLCKTFTIPASLQHIENQVGIYFVGANIYMILLCFIVIGLFNLTKYTFDLYLMIRLCLRLNYWLFILQYLACIKKNIQAVVKKAGSKQYATYFSVPNFG